VHPSPRVIHLRRLLRLNGEPVSSFFESRSPLVTISLCTP
jgi:hypothetical protein